MNQTAWDQLFARLRVTPFQIAIVMSGGGSGALAECFRRSGASANFVEAVIPYSQRAMSEYLSQTPLGSAASLETAKQLAEVAHQRAQRLGEPNSQHCVGLALVAALPTSRPRRGDDRIHVAAKQTDSGVSRSIQLAKNEFSRESAEEVADQLIYLALADIAELSVPELPLKGVQVSRY
ncbi:MAG: hypothetical protein AB8B91_08680 [Rubripirellula sp.]